MYAIPEPVNEALQHILNGTPASDCESALLDFKEDPEVHGSTSEAKLIELLIDECICLANGEDADSYLVLGVNDKKAGSPAFTGTSRNPDWIERRIHSRTEPNLRVEATAFTFADTRLIAIRITEPLTLYTGTKGRGSYRVGTNCLPLTEEDRRRILQRRHNTDWTAKISELSPDELPAEYTEAARKILTQRRRLSGDNTLVPTTTLGLLRDLGLLGPDGKSMKEAARILLAPMPAGRISIKHLWRTHIGAAPKVTEITAPLITAIGIIRDLIEQHASAEIARVHLDSGQEAPIPAFPSTAVDEVILNALVHRDWNYVAPVVVDQTPRTLVITSPGPFPYGVTTNNLLNTTSVPRNPTLMSALRTLGLVEETSQGFDRMWVSMLQTGREHPEVDANDSSVKVILAAGKPDVDFIRALYRLAQVFGADEIYSINVLIILAHLHRYPLITFDDVVAKTQISKVEAQQILIWLSEDTGLLKQLENAEEWTLSDRAAELMGKSARVPSVSNVQHWIQEKLHQGETINAREAAETLGVDRQLITNTLIMLRSQGLAMIDPNGPTRGSNVRWKQQ